MKIKFTVAVPLVLVLTLALLMPAAYAEKGKGMGDCHQGIEEKVSYKTRLFLKNQEELGLSDEQIKKIKDLNLQTMKDSIKAKAEIEIIALDIKAKMQEETIDTAAINKLIDEKYELKKAKAKSSVKAYAGLKNILTKEQKEKLKGLFKKCEIKKKK